MQLILPYTKILVVTEPTVSELILFDFHFGNGGRDLQVLVERFLRITL